MNPFKKFSFMKKMNRVVKSLDQHGVPITLLYKNEPTYKTLLGGYFSIIKIFLILGYISYSLIDVF